MAKQALALVQNQEPKEVRGDAHLTDEAVASWKKGQRVCRARKRHNWNPFTVVEHASYYDVVEQCSHCRNRRRADFSKQGRKLTKWKPDYRDGYLLPKGAAPLDDDTRDELMLSDLLSRRIIEAVDDDEEV